MFKQIISQNTKFVPRCLNFNQIRTKFSLPELDYPVKGGVEPAFDGRQLDFHYNKHHQTYVNNLNNLVADSDFELYSLDKLIIKTQADGNHVGIYNNAAQHFNHSFFWKCLVPNPNQEQNEPSADLQRALTEHFGSVEKFKKEFNDAALKLFGSGWTWLVVDPETKKLKIWSGSNAQCPIGHQLVPLLTVDVWEHAYYLVHQNRRNEYLQGFLSCVNWKFVEANYKTAMRK